MLKNLDRLIRVPSVSQDEAKTLQALDEALAIAEEFGLKTRKAAGGQVGVVSIGSGEEILGILTHVDVVPEGSKDAWTKPPYRLTQEDGKLYGRGTLDDKGPLIASLYALKFLKDSGMDLYKEVQLIIGTREEIVWDDMERYAKEERLPDYGFTPDDAFPICNAEKGYVDIELEIPCGGRVETGFYPVAAAAGTSNNTVPDHAELVLARFENGMQCETRIVTAAGRAAHSSEPERGDNAILKLADLLDKENVQENRLSALLRELCKNLKDIYGSPLGLNSESEYYKGEYVHRNTFCPTVLKTEDGVLRVNINGRISPPSAPEDIWKKFDEFAGSLGGKAVIMEGLPAVFIEKTSPFIGKFVQAYEECTGLKNEFRISFGTSYAKAMPNIAAWGPLLPGDTDTCHEVDENISLKTLTANAEIFAMAIGEIAGSKESFKL